MVLIQSAIIAKNFIYKAIVLKGEMRIYIAKLSLSIITGLLFLPLTFVMIQVFRIDENIANTFLTFYCSIIIIYTLWSYLEYARIRFKYSDKTRLIILFLIIFSISITSSFTFQPYRQAYYRGIEGVFRQVMHDVADGRGDQAYYAARYGAQAEFITARDAATGRERFLLGSQPQFLMFYAEVPQGAVRHDVKLQGKKVNFFFTGRSGTNIVQAGFSYIRYRRYIHQFVSIGFFTSLGIVLVVYFMLRFMVSISLINPLRGLLNGIEEIKKGNLDHRIPAIELDEIGYISQEFNHMISDLKERNDEIQRSEKKYRELMAPPARHHLRDGHRSQHHVLQRGRVPPDGIRRRRHRERAPDGGHHARGRLRRPEAYALPPDRQHHGQYLHPPGHAQGRELLQRLRTTRRSSGRGTASWASAASSGTSPRRPGWSSASYSPRRWRSSAALPGGSPMTSITSLAGSSAASRSSSTS